MKIVVNKYRYFITSIFCLSTSLVSSETLSIQNVISSALLYHPLITASKTESASAIGEIESANGGFDPTFKIASSDYISGNYSGGYLDTSIEQPTTLYGSKFIAGYRKSKGDFPVYYGDQITQNGGEVRAGVEIPILRDGEIDRRRTAIEKAKIQKVIGDASFFQRQVEIRRGAKVAYYDWCAAGRKVEIQKELLTATELRQAQLKHRASSGDLPSFDVIDNERTVFQRKALVLQAERLLKQTAYELSLYYRDNSGAPIIPSDSLLPKENVFATDKIILPVEIYYDQAIEQRPDLKKLKEQKNQNDLEIKLAKNQLLPRADLQILAAQDLGTAQNKLDEFEMRGGVKIEFPFFNSTAKGKLASLEAKNVELTSLISFLEQRIFADIKDVVAALNLTKQRIELSSKEYEIAKKVESGERHRFLEGDSTLIFVNLREQASADSAIRIIDTKLEYLKAKASLEAILADVVL